MSKKTELFIKIHFIPRKKHYVSNEKINRLALFREAIAIFCENHMKYTNTLCGQNAEF
jgi:hypothetical protein